MDLGAHAFTQRRVHELVLLHARLAAKGGAHDQRLEMMTVAVNLDVLTSDVFGNPVLDLLGIDQFGSLAK